MVRYFDNPYIGPSGEIPPNTTLPSSEDLKNEAFRMIKDCFWTQCQRVSTHDGGLYVGGVGVAWAGLRVSQQLGVDSTDFLTQVREYIERLVNKAAQDNPRDSEERLSFLLGYPGIWLTAAYLYQITGDKVSRDHFLGLYAQLASVFASLQSGGSKVIFRQGSDELFIGRAGYLCGLYELRRVTSEAVVSDDLVFAICDAIIDSGKTYAQRHHSRCPLMYAYHGTEYLGAAHGLVGILFALMLFPSYLRARAQAAELVRAAIDYLIAVTPAETGNLPAATDELAPRHRYPSEHELVHWCHGAAGAVYVYVRAYVLWRDEKYLQEVLKCADVAWRRGLLKKGPGICHGVAGSGYVQLVAERLLELSNTERDRRVYFERARACADFMLNSEVFRRGARTPDNPFSLYEGRAGTACFLADLAGRDPAARLGFPFMDPFAPDL